MIKKGIISNVVGNYAEVVLPEENNVVTPQLPIANLSSYGELFLAQFSVGARCVVAFFDSDTVNLADGVIIAIY